MSKIVIIGSGLAGLSASFHLKHENCEIFEKNDYCGGHIYSHQIDGFTFDEGPHVSFTKHEYVKNLFAKNVNDDFLEYPVTTVNFHEGNWIPHPAQSNLYAVPEPLKSACLSSFNASRRLNNDNIVPANYGEWLNLAFGEIFTNEFPRKYTRKYWTTEPENLTTKWVGERVFFPNIEDVNNGAISPLAQQTHYISKIRYPNQGGYFAFAKPLSIGAQLFYDYELLFISFAKREITFKNGIVKKFETLINTIPLPQLILLSDAPIYVKDAASQLNCSSVLLINVMANHPTQKKENWFYVYDEDKYATRINCTEVLSPNNAPNKKSGIQVEVYFSEYKKPDNDFNTIAAKVCQELIEMGLLIGLDYVMNVETKFINFANVIFDHKREQNLEIVLGWLSKFGLERESDDLEPMTKWEEKQDYCMKLGSIILAGRFAQWKYYWTDDCVLRGKFIGENF